MRGDDSALNLATNVCFSFINVQLERDEQIQMQIHNVMYPMHEKLWDCMNRIIISTKRKRLQKPIVFY
jgi:hypothetical protein